MTIILGPCECIGCGETVWWAYPNGWQPQHGTRIRTRGGRVYFRAGWRDANGERHLCVLSKADHPESWTNRSLVEAGAPVPAGRVADARLPVLTRPSLVP